MCKVTNASGLSCDACVESIRMGDPPDCPQRKDQTLEMGCKLFCLQKRETRRRMWRKICECTCEFDKGDAGR